MVRGLLAVQAQDLRAARLALRARGELFSAADVDEAITEKRSLVRGWLGRGTLHFVAREDYRWLHALTAPARFAANARRLGQEGVPEADAERALTVIEKALADEGPLSRAALAERVAVKDIRSAGQATPHLIMLAVLRGVAILGPIRRGAQDIALARDWLGEAEEPDRDTALAELARRYLSAHGPASAADLATWIGLPLRDARSGLEAIAGELLEVGDGLVDLAAHQPAPEPIPARLLPAFDPYLLGWKDRSFAVPAEHARRVHPGGGIVRPTAIVDGIAVGTWNRREGLDAFAAIPRAAAGELEAEAADILRFEA